jgi:hypothetical protein
MTFEPIEEIAAAGAATGLSDALKCARNQIRLVRKQAVPVYEDSLTFLSA